MKLTLIQNDLSWHNADANRRAAEELMRSADTSDLYILPEMFTTGFDVHPATIAEQEEGDTLLWMKAMATELDAAVAGSVAVIDATGAYKNRFYFVKPDGVVDHYDKSHLFSYGGENEEYTPGPRAHAIEWRGMRFLPQVCYDLRFPVFSRNAMVEAPDGKGERLPMYDCCIYVANWPASRRRVWDTLLQARAIENQAYVVGVNRVGSDPLCNYSGGTAAVDAYGRIMKAAPDNSVATVTVELDMSVLTAFRKKFPVLLDGNM